MNYLKHLNHVPVKLYNPETLDYRDRVWAAGGTISQASLDAVEKFVRDCKDSHVWSRLIEVGVFAGGNLNAALVKLIHPPGSPSSLTNVNFIAGDYAERGPNGGLLGDGATKHLNTGCVANAQLPDNGHFSFYLREDVGAAGNRAFLGALAGSDQYWLGAVTPASSVLVRYGQTLHAGTGQAMLRGFYCGSRAAPNALAICRDGARLGSDANTATHAKPALPLHLWAFNNTGAAAAHLPARGSFYSLGHGLADPEAAALNQAVQTLQRNLDRAN